MWNIWFDLFKIFFYDDWDFGVECGFCLWEDNEFLIV